MITPGVASWKRNAKEEIHVVEGLRRNKGDLKANLYVTNSETHHIGWKSSETAPNRRMTASITAYKPRETSD
jgi:hypothetical protein